MNSKGKVVFQTGNEFEDYTLNLKKPIFYP